MVRSKTTYPTKYKSFCKLLMEARKTSGLSQAVVSKKLKKKHQSFMSKVEGGERVLDFIEALELFKILKVDILKFISDLEELEKLSKEKRKKKVSTLEPLVK